MRRDSVAVDALGFLGIPLDEAETIVDLANCFGEALAVLLDHDFGESAFVGPHQFEPYAQKVAALFGKPARPVGKRFAGTIDSGFNLGFCHIGRCADDLAIGGVVYINHSNFLLLV